MSLVSFSWCFIACIVVLALCVAGIHAGGKDSSQYVFDTSRFKRYTFPTHVTDLLIDRSLSAASEVFIVILKPGQAPPLHKHDDTEQVFYLIEGEGILTIGEDGKTFPVNKGDVVRIPPATFHKVEAAGKNEMKYLAVDCFVQGKPKGEPTWNDHIRNVCRENGWDFNAVTK